ncbi:MAG: hypothetical protein VX286_03310 [Bacteroidota bacterium]|nr:hypothetical protein [Bacteroidota bacterium]
MRPIILLLAAVLSVSLCSAQSTVSPEAETPSYVRLVMFDGSSRMGELIESSDLEIVIETIQLGVVRVPKYLVKGMTTLAAREYEQLVVAFEGRELALNPQSSRYFFAPSGIQLRQGDGYFQSNIALNSVSFGVTENITIGGLLSLAGAGGSVKIGKQLSPDTYASFGGIGFMDYYGNFDRPIGLVFANMTWGTEDRNVTVNIGTGTKIEDGLGEVFAYTLDSTEYVWDPGQYYYSYNISEYDQEWVRPLLVNISAMNRISENRWFITENYWVQNLRYSTRITGASLISSYVPVDNGFNPQSDGFAILSMGIRNLSTRNGWLWDYGMVGVLGGDFGFAAPWVSATLAF